MAEQIKDENAHDLEVFKSRFWVLGIFSLTCLLEATVWGTFGPIMASTKYAYGWNDGYIALLDAWGPINSVIFIVPLSYFNQKYGIRNGMIVTTSLMAIGTAGRCIPSEDSAFIYLASFGAILVGMASGLTQSLPVMISAIWFPASERTTATATIATSYTVSTIMMYLSPLLVHYPEEGITKEQIKKDINKLMLIHFGLALVLLVCVLIYFPAKPPKPPSVSAAADRIEYFNSIKVIFQSRKSVTVLMAYALSYGVHTIWMTVMNFSLSCLGFNQKDSMFVVFTAGVVTIISGLMCARLSDKIQGSMKRIIIILLSIASVFFFWFLLIVAKWISNPSYVSIFIVVVGGVSTSSTIAPILFEFATEVAYPCPESSIGALAILLLDSNGIVFLLLMMIPTECYQWLSYALFLSVFVPILMLMTVKNKQTRLEVDSKPFTNYQSIQDN